MNDGWLVLRFGVLSLRARARALLANVALLFLLLVLAYVAMTVGSRTIALPNVIRWLAFSEGEPVDVLVLAEFRAPRIVLAMTAGAMLALSGAVAQHQTRNGLADPSLLGVREGASLLIVLMLLFWPAMPLVLRPLIGLVGGLSVGLCVTFVSRGGSPLKFVMSGFGISWCLSSALVIVLSTADVRSLQTFMIWLAGSLENANWQAVQIACAILVLAGTAIVWLARETELEDMGADAAITLGAGRTRRRIAVLVAAVLLVAGSVSVVGGLGFVGLIAPHLTRFLPRQGLRGHLLSNLIVGAMLVLASDTFGRTVFAPVILPAGISLAAIGAPMLVLLLWLRRNRI